MPASRSWIALGAVLAGLAVAAGAFGAHALKDRLTPGELVTFEVAVRYQMYHAIAIVLVGMLASRTFCGRLAGGAFLLGELLFCGGLYGFVFTGTRALVHVVPFGGAAFIVGWIALAVAAYKTPSPAAGVSSGPN